MKNYREYGVGDIIRWKGGGDFEGIITAVTETEYIYKIRHSNGQFRDHPGFDKNGLHQVTKLVRKASKLSKILE